MEDKYKTSAWLFIVYGGVMIAFIFTMFNWMERLNNFPSITYILLSILLIGNMLTLMCGIFLLKNNDNAHKFGIPVAIFTILNFPLGTIVGGIYLWTRFKSI
jgi:hypothetical protein